VTELAPEEVAAALGLGTRYDAWLEDLASFAPLAEPARLPDAERAAALLRRLGCPGEVVRDTAATLFSPAQDAARSWLLERCHRRLLATMGDAGATRGEWPQLPRRLGTAGRCFHLHVFLATLHATRAWHAERDVPEEVSWATLADLGRHTARHLRMTGTSGIDEPWWTTLHLRAILFELGRLQYVNFRLGIGPEHPTPWMGSKEAGALGEGFRAGDHTVGVHIPGGEPLDPERCEASMRAARRFFDSRFPVPTRRVATCSSWLLDEQLAALLPAGSNIVAFGRSFHLVPGWWEGDDEVLNFVFERVRPSLGDLPQRTSLERAVVAHLRNGGHFHWRTGWRDLPEAG
jgi:hypothetical protein